MPIYTRGDAVDSVAVSQVLGFDLDLGLMTLGVLHVLPVYVSSGFLPPPKTCRYG